MTKKEKTLMKNAKAASLKVLHHNAHGPYRGLPRTAGWGYPEPYTRDLLISSLGILASKDKELMASLRRVLITLSINQSELGHIPSLVHDPDDRGSSDCTPLFLMAVGLWRKVTGENGFLNEPVKKSLTWMEYRSPSNRYLIAQLPTSDWRDEQWVLGYGLYVNSLTYIYLKLLDFHERAEKVKELMKRFVIDDIKMNRHIHEGLTIKEKPYLAMWSYKIYKSQRFDLLGNSLAMLGGITSKSRTQNIISWIEAECREMKKKEMLSADVPPNFFPFIKPGDPDWLDRYKIHNNPGEYHNGGIWPFICGFYISALVKAEKYKLAEKKLIALTELNKPARESDVEFGFNEWLSPKNGLPKGQDWQSWSAAMYLYASSCVQNKKTFFFDY